MILDLLCSLVFLCALAFFGLYRREGVQSTSAYLLADRQMGFFALTATLVMTELNTATLLSFSSLGYLGGVGALSFPLVFLIGLLFYAVTVAKKWRGFDGFSVASYFSKRYGRDVGILAGVALFVAMAVFSGAYLKSLSLLFQPLFLELNTWVLSGLFVSFILMLMLRGGLFSIMRTDVFSFVVVLLFFPLMAFFASRGEQVSAVVETVSWQFVLSLIVLTMFTYILAPWYGQKIFAAKSERVAFFSVLCAALLIFLLYGLGVMSTWFLKRNGVELSNPEQALPMVLMGMPSGLKGLGFTLLFAASATTLSGVWSAMCTLITDEKGSVTRSRGHVVMIALSTFVLANTFVDRVLDKIILANIPIAALSFALLGGFYWKKTSRAGVYASIIVGWAVGVGSYLIIGQEEYTWCWTVIGIPIIFISGIIGSLLAPNKKLDVKSAL
ncbi:MAG: hypothetical protein P0S96_04615 [Simkaniaceae bacterium]|nr:hypothetical protein [Candidatus Sacchlamyda saccharinae]